MASLVPTVPRALRGTARTAGQEMFSSFNVFIVSWKQMTCLEWSLPSQCHRTELSCEIWRADLLALYSSPRQTVRSGHITWRWPHQGDFSVCSPLKMLFPARVPFSVSSSMKIRSFLTDISYSSIWYIIWYMIFLTDISYPSVGYGRPGFCNLPLQRLGFTVTIRDQILYTGSERAALVKLMINRKKEKIKGNSELFPLFSYHSKLWEILKQNMCFGVFFLKSLVKSWQIVNVQR